MRVNIHDFSGHPFQVELSRELASRGHEVLHGFSTQFVTGRGRLAVRGDDPATLRIEGLTAPAPMIKYSIGGRTRFEIAYAQVWQAALELEPFDVVVACNVPLFSLAMMRRYFARKQQPWVLWHQDLYSLGVSAEAERRLPRPLAGAAAKFAVNLERSQLRNADAVVAITDSMIRQYETWQSVPVRTSVIPNWAPLDEVQPGSRDNAWSRRHDVPVQPVRLMYAGTLGRKHNPLLLLELVDKARARGLNVHLVVVSEGEGADMLAAAAADRDDVQVLGYQPAEDVGDMLASADAVVALLEPDAANFSVPSKVMTYLAAGRPIIGLIPEGNPAAQDVLLAGGYVGPPDPDGVAGAVGWLAGLQNRPKALMALGVRARALAQQRFAIGPIGDRFETLLNGVVRSRAVATISHLAPADASWSDERVS